MEKEFLEYAEALALKELGFDEPYFGYYAGDILCTGRPQEINLDKDGNYKKTKTESYPIIAAPTYSQAFRWFREKYEIEATTSCFYSKRLNILYEERQYHCHVVRDGVTSKGPRYKTFEEAELACLKKLIEIVKEKL